MASPIGARVPFGALTDPNGNPVPSPMKAGSDISIYRKDVRKSEDHNGANALESELPESILGSVQGALLAAKRNVEEATLGSLHFSDFVGNHQIELIRLIGEGGFGTVYLAQSSRHNEPVALKMIGHGGDAEEMADIAREVAIHDRLIGCPLSDPRFFVRLHSHYTQEVRSVLLMEFCCGVELEEYTRGHRHGRLDEGEARSIAALLIDAVACCHAAGVAHLDVTPRNILVTAAAPAESASAKIAEASSCTQTLKLIDYGAADFFGQLAPSPKKAAGEEEMAITMALRGYVRERGGAPNYRAPERHAADEDDDEDGGGGDEDGERAEAASATYFNGPAADSFGVGATIFFMLTGCDAFDFASLQTDDDDDDDGEAEEGTGHISAGCRAEAAAQRQFAREQLFDDIAAGAVPFDKAIDSAPAADVSDSAKRLVRRLLAHSPEARPSMLDARRDEWLVKGGSPARGRGSGRDDDAAEGLLSKLADLAL